MSNELINAKVGEIITLNDKKYKLVESDVRSRIGYLKAEPTKKEEKIYELRFILLEVREDE
ncbi:hypothetical protein LCGC14_2811300 [marine sediment metagenome]|uniref:Uncharacterized protein n=1 Tax=marine sediment metagenome TaxID=412755 RepID=A0A0F9AT73_9ZZZZ